MTVEFRQDYQDHRTWVLEQLITTERWLDPRMYECADHCVNTNLINDRKEVLAEWENWKKSHPLREGVSKNRL